MKIKMFNQVALISVFCRNVKPLKSSTFVLMHLSCVRKHFCHLKKMFLFKYSCKDDTRYTIPCVHLYTRTCFAVFFYIYSTSVDMNDVNPDAGRNKEM